MAVKLEKQLASDLDYIWISAKLMRDGGDVVPPLERLEWIQMIVREAIQIQKKIDKRNAKEAK